jgi:hypothetical protein
MSEEYGVQAYVLMKSLLVGIEGEAANIEWFCESGLDLPRKVSTPTDRAHVHDHDHRALDLESWIICQYPHLHQQ